MEINPILQKKRKENIVNNSLVRNVNYLPCCTKELLIKKIRYYAEK